MSHIISALEFYKRFSARYDVIAEARLLTDPRTIFNAVSDFVTPAMKYVLDVGIGTGLSSLPFQEHDFQIEGVDGSEEMLRQCEDKGITKKLEKVDLEDGELPYDDDYFDITVSHATLYLVENSKALLREMIRVTCPGGLIAFTYEPSPDDQIRVRKNDATFDLKDPRAVKTFALPPHNVRDVFHQHGLHPLAARTAPAMTKGNGETVIFEALVYKKPSSFPWGNSFLP